MQTHIAKSTEINNPSAHQEQNSTAHFHLVPICSVRDSTIIMAIAIAQLMLILYNGMVARIFGQF